MCILSTRKVGPTDAVALATALTINKSLRELLASGHRLGVSEASAFGRALASNTALRSLCLGDHDFGDEVYVDLDVDGYGRKVSPTVQYSTNLNPSSGCGTPRDAQPTVAVMVPSISRDIL